MRVMPAVVTALVVITGLTAPAPAQADPNCLGDPVVGVTIPLDPDWVLTDRDTVIRISVWGATTTACPDLTATVQKTDGSQRTVVALDRDQAYIPPSVPAGAYGMLPLRVADGAGEWVVVQVSDGATSRATARRFTIPRGTVGDLDPPRPEYGATPTTVTGIVRQYTSAGTLAPAPGRLVRIVPSRREGPPPPVLALVRTDVRGRFAARIALSRSTVLHGEVLASATHAYHPGDLVTAYRLLALTNLTAAPTAVLGDWWKVSGRALPGNQWSLLEYWDGSRWVFTHSFGQTAADGTFARYLRAPIRGALKVRLTIGAPAQQTGLLNTPLRRVLTIQVGQPAPRPTYLTGHFGPTHGGPVRTGTMMSTFGRLQLRRSDGRLVPMYDESVEIQTWARGDAGWRTRETGRTTATGYFYRNWYMPYPAGANVAVRVLFRAPYPTSLPSARILGAVVVR